MENGDVFIWIVKMFLVRLCLFVCVNLFLCAKCSIPVEKLCADPTCTKPISVVQGKLNYSPHTAGVLGFTKNQKFVITSKSKNKEDYWGAIINGKSGYVPSEFVLEKSVYHVRENLIPVSGETREVTPTEAGNPVQNNTSEESPAKDGSHTSNQPQPVESVVGKPSNPEGLQKPIKPEKTFKIIEGTTIYVDEPDEITPSSTVGSASQTVAPVSANAKSKDDAQERATIPPEIINLNANYKDQTSQRETNFTIEKVKENDENLIVESKDINADDGDEDDGEEDDEEEEADDEDDDNLEDELQENQDNQITENNVNEDKLKSGVTAEGKLEESTVGNTHSNSMNVEDRTSQTVINVVENSVTSKVSASIGDSKTEGEKEEPAKLNPQPSQNAGTNKLEHPSWRMLNDHQNSIPSQPPSGSSETVLGTPQPIMSGPPESQQAPAGPYGIPSDPPATPDKPHAVPSKAQFIPPGLSVTPIPLQAVPSEPQQVPESQTLPPEPLSTPPTPQQVPPEPPVTLTPQGILPELMEAPIKPPVVPAEQRLENEVPTKQQTVSFETGGGAGPPQEVTTEASVAALENATGATGAVNQFPEPAIPSETQQKPADEFRSTSHLSPSETTTIFSQFSVSADSLPDNSTNTVENPLLTPEMIQEKMEATPETFSEPPQPLITETNNHISGSQTWKHLSPPSEVTPESIKEGAEAATEATITPSSSPQMMEEESEGGDQKETRDHALEEGAENKAEEPGVLTQITGMFSKWFTSTPGEKESDSETHYDAAFTDIPANEKWEREISGKCPNGGFGSDCGDSHSEEQPTFPGSWIPSGWGVETVLTPSNTFTYLVVTAVTVLLFTLGHNFIEKRGKTGPLIAKINKLEHEFLVSSKECLMLKEEVQSLREKIVLYENSANDELVLSLQSELDQSKKARLELEASIEVLQQELDSATEAGLDLNKMLSEVLTQKGGSESLLKSVESLQAQLDSQQKVIDEMTKKLGVKNQENEALQTALEAANDKSEGLEEQLGDIKRNLNLHLKEKEDLTRDLNSQINQLKTRINQLGESKEKDVSRLKKELDELKKKLSESSSALTVKEEELKSLKESVKHLKGKGDVKLETVFDVSRVKGELAKEVKENQALVEKLQKEENGKKALAEQVKSLEEEMQKLKKGYEEAEQKKDEAEKKLEVLSTYFKEKETQLQKELGLQEALWAQKKGDEKTVYNMMKSLQEEVESYKSQNETLKKEILDQERGLKNQIVILEQKAHENWVAARQAERKLEESKQEMAQLRNRLTLLEKNNNNAEGKANLRSSEELNNVEAASPILHDTSSPLLFPPLPLDPNSSSLLPPGFIPPPMFMPPPMGGFMPPPPFLPGDRRPPPLGRMSSPPLNNRFSPSSPADYPFERMSSPPLSPHGNNYRSPNDDREHYRHRTPPYPPPLNPRNWNDSNELPGFIPISSQRDSRRDHKGSNVSSEHSSSESLDKSSRHSGRV